MSQRCIALVCCCRPGLPTGSRGGSGLVSGVGWRPLSLLARGVVCAGAMHLSSTVCVTCPGRAGGGLLRAEEGLGSLAKKKGWSGMLRGGWRQDTGCGLWSRGTTCASCMSPPARVAARAISTAAAPPAGWAAAGDNARPLSTPTVLSHPVCVCVLPFSRRSQFQPGCISSSSSLVGPPLSPPPALGRASLVRCAAGSGRVARCHSYPSLGLGKSVGRPSAHKGPRNLRSKQAVPLWAGYT